MRRDAINNKKIGDEMIVIMTVFAFPFRLTKILTNINKTQAL